MTNFAYFNTNACKRKCICYKNKFKMSQMFDVRRMKNNFLRRNDLKKCKEPLILRKCERFNSTSKVNRVGRWSVRWGCLQKAEHILCLPNLLFPIKVHNASRNFVLWPPRHSLNSKYLWMKSNQQRIYSFVYLLSTIFRGLEQQQCFWDCWVKGRELVSVLGEDNWLVG